MKTLSFYLVPRPGSLSFQGMGCTPDGTFPLGAIPCTQTEAEGWQSYERTSPTSLEFRKSLSISLTQAKATQLSRASQACAAAITSGFTSSALGSAHTYPSSLTDQANLVTHVMSSLLPGLPSTWTTPYICCDASGVWAYQDHTAAQIQQVGADWKAFLSSCLLKKKALEEKIKVAKTSEKVQAITW